MKKLIINIWFLTCTFSTISQIPIVFQDNGETGPTPTLPNVGGQVYSIERINFFGSNYVVCGDFNNIDGYGSDYRVQTNHIILNSNFQLTSDTIFTSINGPIRDIAFTYDFNGTLYGIVYIAGDFTEINGHPVNGIARFSVPLIPENSINDLTLDTTWDPGFVFWSNPDDPGKILDLEIHNNVLYCAGNFSAVNNFATLNDGRMGITAIDPGNGSDLGIFSTNQGCNSNWAYGYVSSIKCTNNNIIAGGQIDLNVTGGSFFRFNYNGCIDDTYTPQKGYYAGMAGWQGEGREVEVVLDTIYVGIEENNDMWFDDDPSISFIPVIEENPNSIIQTKTYEQPPPPGYTVEYTTVTAYKDRFYVGTSVSGGPFGTPTIKALDSTGVIWQSIGMWENFPNYDSKHLFVQNNILFGSINSTFNIFSNSYSGLFAYCLDPEDIDNFIAFDSTICHNDTVTYTVPSSTFANGYEWSYSGTGVDLNASQIGIQTELDSHGVTTQIIFLENFTPGTLTVTPFSTCNNHTLNNGRVYSKPLSLNITTNPLPNAYAGLDTIFNCYYDTITLHGHSDTLGVEYEWNESNNPLFPSNFSGQDFVVSDTVSNYYYLRVQAPNGCINRDTVFVDADFNYPILSPITPEILGCNDTVYVIGTNTSTADTISWWINPAFPNDSLSNPLLCTIQGPYTFNIQDTLNGCISDTSVYVDQNNHPPNIEIAGYDSIPSLGTSLDTINCYSPTLTLTAYSDSTGAVLNWVDADTLNPLGDTQLIDSGDIYYLEAYNPNNNCFNYATILVDADFSLPTLAIDPVTAGINCSYDSLILTGSTNSHDTILTWNGPGVNTNSNEVTVYEGGYFSFMVTKNSNGCSSIDSVLVIEDNSIEIVLKADTAACDQSTIQLTASHIGTISGATYLWNSGDIGNTGSFVAGADSYGIVEVFGDGSCYGTDTTLITTPPYPVINLQGFQPCGNGNTGYIVASPISGWSPFEYSIDGVNFQSNSTLSNLSVGTYDVFIKDSLGCIYDFSAEINDESEIPTPEFLFSTYNYESDTVILIDVSSPAPDSVNWEFSSEIIILDENYGSPILILPDTGSFNLTMNAWYGTCLNSVSKVIHVAEFDSTNASIYVQSGIKSIELYPNPNSGDFTLTIEFYKKQNATLSLYDINAYIYEERTYDHTDLIQESFSLPASAINGTFVVAVISEFDSAYITFILNR